MKKIFYTALVLSAVILLAWYSPSRNLLSSSSFSNPIYPHVNIGIGMENFDAVVADNNELKEKGLSGFKGLEKNEAMFFPYEKPTSLPFWMKDMLFSIDILWLDADYKVVYFEKNASPDSYPKVFSPTMFTQYVVEFPAGTLDRVATKIGDKLVVTPRK